MVNARTEGAGTWAGITCLTAAVSAGVGAVSGAIGTTILNAAGYAYPSVKSAAAMGAVGSTILGALTGYCLASCNGAIAGSLLEESMSGILPIVGTQALAGMLGNVILGGVTTLGKDAALSAVGSAVLSGGIVGVGIGFSGYKACFHRDSAVSSYYEITNRTDPGPTRLHHPRA